jgi:hypothetical protein
MKKVDVTAGSHFPFVLVLCRPLVFDVVILPCLCRGRVRGECEYPAWQFLDQRMVVVYTFERVTRHQDAVMRRFDGTRKSLTATEGARPHLRDIGCWWRRGSRCTMMVSWWWEKWLLSQRAVFGASHKVGDAAGSLSPASNICRRACGTAIDYRIPTLSALPSSHVPYIVPCNSRRHALFSIATHSFTAFLNPRAIGTQRML